tara:strand:- start:244 stop:552 length:309 start_codon:yes stop_codon:yes gene_type:complete
MPTTPEIAYADSTGIHRERPERDELDVDRCDDDGPGPNACDCGQWDCVECVNVDEPAEDKACEGCGYTECACGDEDSVPSRPEPDDAAGDAACDLANKLLGP